MIETKTCDSCDKMTTTKGENNFTHCPFCGKPYEKIYRINMCDCNKDIMDGKSCIKCKCNPMDMTNDELKRYYKDLDTQYLTAKDTLDTLKTRIDQIYRKIQNINCNMCSKYENCESCRRLYDL